MRPKARAVLERAVENGVANGWRQAHKYDEHPTPEHIRDTIECAVFNEIGEWFDFEEASHGD